MLLYLAGFLIGCIPFSLIVAAENSQFGPGFAVMADDWFRNMGIGIWLGLILLLIVPRAGARWIGLGVISSVCVTFVPAMLASD